MSPSPPDSPESSFVIIGQHGNVISAETESETAATDNESVFSLAPSEMEFANHVVLTKENYTDANPLTTRGRELLTWTMSPDTLNRKTAAIDTVTIKSKKQPDGCGCTQIIDTLSEEANDLQLDTVVLWHDIQYAGYDTECPLDSYRQCLTVNSLRLKARHFVVINHMSSRLPISFMMSSQASAEGGESPIPQTIRRLVRLDDEKIHMGILNSKNTSRVDEADASVTPHHKYSCCWSDLACQTAPRVVSLVDVAVKSDGEHANIGDPVHPINQDATRAAIEEWITKFPGFSAQRKRSDGTGTQYNFVDRETFDASTEGKILAEYRALTERK